MDSPQWCGLGCVLPKRQMTRLTTVEEIFMSRLILVTTVALLALSPTAFAASADDCKAMWTKLDAKNAGKINGDAAKPYVAALDAAKMPAAGAKDGVVTADEFMAACQKDAFKDIK
jgi:hypothetical protein